MNKKECRHKYLHVRIPNELAHAIEVKAVKSYKSKSQIFRDALSFFLAKKDPYEAQIIPKES